MKPGDRVKISSDYNGSNDKLGTILYASESYDWFVRVDDMGYYPFYARELQVIGCPCSISGCVKHRAL